MWTLYLQTFHTTRIRLWSVHIYPRNKIVAMTYASTHVYIYTYIHILFIQGGRKINVLLLTVVGDVWKDQKCIGCISPLISTGKFMCEGDSQSKIPTLSQLADHLLCEATAFTRYSNDACTSGTSRVLAVA